MLEGTKAVIRAVEPGDAERVQRWVNGGEAPSWLDRIPAAFSRKSQEQWLEAAGAAKDPELRVFSVETRDSRHVGLLVLRNLHWVHRRATLELLIGEPEYREAGFEADVLRVACRFAFSILNLHRLEARVPAGSVRLQACLSAGFVDEGRLRESVFEAGQHRDEIVLGALATHSSESAPSGAQLHAGTLA